jgi:hypothetical protein
MSFNTLSNAFNFATSHRQSVQFGLNINIGTRKDRDGDGVRDKADSCYKTFGVMSNNGCPLGFLGGSMNYDETTVDSAASAPETADEPKSVKPVKGKKEKKAKKVKSNDPEMSSAMKD